MLTFEYLCAKIIVNKKLKELKMKSFKKLLAVFTVTLTATLLLGIFSACGHTHEFSEWKTVTPATCTQNGEKVRECLCGEKETAAISATGHAYIDGVCKDCNADDPDYIPSATEGLEYTLNEDGESYSVTGIGTATDTTIVIASTYEEKPVTAIGDMAFVGINMNNGEPSICANIVKIIIPDCVVSIGTYAFAYCSSLENVNIPNGVTNIGFGAFGMCSSLKSVNIPETVISIEDQAFYSCKALTSINVSGTNSKYCSIDGNLYSKDATVLIQYATGKSETSFIIPRSVTSIDVWALYNCTNLTSILVEENNANYSSIDGNLYSKDGAIFIQYAAGKTETSFIVPENVTEINYSSFRCCNNLKSVTIHKGVTYIGEWAFLLCENLTEFVFNGTMAEWIDMYRDNTWVYMMDNYVIVCTDGTLDKDENVVEQ